MDTKQQIEMLLTLITEMQKAVFLNMNGHHLNETEKHPTLIQKLKEIIKRNTDDYDSVKTSLKEEVEKVIELDHILIEMRKEIKALKEAKYVDRPEQDYDALKLAALEACDVVNWEGYPLAMSMYNDMKSEYY